MDPSHATGSVEPVLLELDDMRLLVALGEELHFGRAAQRLHLSQPGLSYRLKRLEDSLGYQLLARSRRSVELTPAGHVVLRGAHRLLAEARRTADDGGRVARGETVTLRVGFVGTALYSLLPDVLRELRRRHPDLRLLLEEQKTATQVRALLQGQLDLGVVHLPLPPGTDLQMEVAMTDVMGVALPHDHPLAGREAVALVELANESFVLFPRELEPQTYDSYVGACVSAGFAPRVAQQATGLQTILGLVAGGVGVAFVAGSVGQHLARRGVLFRPLRGPGPTLTTGTAWREPAHSPAATLVRHVIRDVASTSTDHISDQSHRSPHLELLLD